MDNKDQIRDWELIEGYYQRTLSAVDQQRMEHRLATEPDFRANAEAWKQADTALRELALRNVVQKTVRQEFRRQQWIGRLRIGVATLLVGCMAVGWLLFSSVDLGAYQQDVTILKQYRRDSPEKSPSWTPRQQAFYQDFFDGQSYLADGQPELAIPYFERVLSLPNLRPYFRQAVEWQLVNAYLQTHQPGNADSTYQRLTANGKPIYPIEPVDRWRVQWQIGWQKIVH